MIQWYPGHMAKAIREIKEKVSIVDLVIVLLDSRIPISSFNPLIKETLNNKKTLYVLTKSDLADSNETKKWIEHYSKAGNRCIAINSKNSKNKKIVIDTILDFMKDKILKDQSKGLKKRPIRTMVVGIPNVGKSTFINFLVNKKVTSVGDTPGVTKTQQWIRIHEDLELLDTPGVLWPKFETEEIGYNLAIIGSIKDDILNMEDVCEYALDNILKYKKESINIRYNIIKEYTTSKELMNLIGESKKWFLNNGSVDLYKVSIMVIKDIRDIVFGPYSFERI